MREAIEEALAKHEDVLQFAVTETNNVYVAGRHLKADQLREHLGAPAQILILESLPLQSDGQVDRDALPLPDMVRPDLGTPYEPPRNPIEASIAEIWARLLRIDRVGIRDAFSELGGDSLLSVQITSEVWHRFGIEIAEDSIVGSTTVAELMETIL